jgi:hypothetical protein
MKLTKQKKKTKSQGNQMKMRCKSGGNIDTEL